MALMDDNNDLPKDKTPGTPEYEAQCFEYQPNVSGLPMERQFLIANYKNTLKKASRGQLFVTAMKLLALQQHTDVTARKIANDLSSFVGKEELDNQQAQAKEFLE